MMTMQQRWIFGYGSLMWNPGFPHVAAYAATLTGYHRSLCVRSTHYRGTVERPGLVLGLDDGGVCRGVAFAVEPASWPDVLDYLRQREQVTMVYRETMVPVTLVHSGECVEALTFVVDRDHPQYMGALPSAERIALVRQGHGLSGSSLQYVESTVEHLQHLGISDPDLEAVLAQARSITD